MYRRPKFLEVLHAIREEMSREADYDVDRFAEMVRTSARTKPRKARLVAVGKDSEPRKMPARRSPKKRRVG
jgi:hypothetical protein